MYTGSICTYSAALFTAASLLATLCFAAGPALAQPIEESPAEILAPAQPTGTEIQRFSIEAGLGSILFHTFVHARLGYRLPVFEDRLDLLIDYSPLGQSLNASASGWSQQTLLLGARGYFMTSG